MKPSERITELARQWHSQGIDPHFNGNIPTMEDYINAILQFFDEEEKSGVEK